MQLFPPVDRVPAWDSLVTVTGTVTGKKQERERLAV